MGRESRWPAAPNPRRPEQTNAALREEARGHRGYQALRAAQTASDTKQLHVSGAGHAWRRRAALPVRGLRYVLSLALLLYAAGCVALLVVGLVRAGRAAQFPAIRVLHQVIDPLVNVAAGLKLNYSYHGFSFVLLGLAIVAFFLRKGVNRHLARMEARLLLPTAGAQGPIRALMDEARAKEAVGKPGAAGAGRGSMLREYAAAKQILGQAKKQLAFLSIDVVGSTKMKVGEDKIVIEHAFTEYKKFLERIFREFHVYKVAWTPDGVMTCFPSVDDAAGAARKVLTELDWFNRDTHQLHTKFRVRCGLNFGEVLVPSGKPLEEISDEVIDVAGHLQKYAEEDSLWISAEAYRHHLTDRNAFTRLDRQVDNRVVYVWHRAS